MARTEQLSQYASLLKIRQKARRRDAIIIGSVFLIVVFATIALGLLDELQGRSIYLILGLTLAFGLGFVQTWVRLEIINASLELVDYLQRELTPNR
jgi:Zn-dependent protease with chaperone function